MRKRIEGLIRRKIAFFDGPLEHGALVVCNHSGGVLTPDVLVFAPAFYDESCASRRHLDSVVRFSISGVSICVVRTAVRVL